MPAPKRTFHFCHSDDCCPVVKEYDQSVPENKQLEITDDFGGSAKMSRHQFAAFVTAAKNGEFDEIQKTDC